MTFDRYTLAAIATLVLLVLCYFHRFVFQIVMIAALAFLATAFVIALASFLRTIVSSS